MQQGRPRPGRHFIRCPLVLTLMALPASADHPRDVRNALDGLRANNLAAVAKVFQKDASRAGADRLLALYELGGCHHLAGDPGRSLGFFNTADAVAREYEGQALISASEAARNAGAVLTSDAALKYEGFGYEKVMARTLNAINYLFIGDMEGARVEVRKAEEYQLLERERHQREIRRAGQRPPQGAESARLDNPAVAARYGRLFDSVRNVRNSFENAFTYYLSSQIHLARGEDGLNDAAVEIRRAFELAPEVPEVRAGYLEIARGQGGSFLDEALAALQVADPGPAPAPGGASVVVIFEAGLMPPLEEVRLDLPANDRLYSLAFPIYGPLGPAQAPLILTAGAGTFSTSRVLDTRLLAVKSLQERMPGLLIRGLLGAMAKGEVQRRTEREYGPFAGLVSKLASAVLTSADRRSWLSLPAEVQVGVCRLSAGRQTLALRGPGVGDSVTLDLAPGSRSFLLVRALPGFQRIDVRTFQAGPVEPAAPPVAGPVGPAPEPAPLPVAGPNL